MTAHMPTSGVSAGSPLWSQAIKDTRRVGEWLDELAYKPGTTFTVNPHPMHYGVQVTITMLVFDSTKPDEVLLHQGMDAINIIPRFGLRKMTDEPVEPVRLGPDFLTGRMIPVRTRSLVPPMAMEDRSAFRHWLRSVLFSLERHEADEWLRDEDGPLFDPHAETKCMTSTSQKEG